MAKAKKLIEADVQAEPFGATLVGWIKKAIAAGKPVEVTAITTDDPDYEQAKSDIQRQKFHAMIGDINKTGVIAIPGRKIVMSNYSAEECKALLVLWFCNEIRELNDKDLKIPNPPKTIICPLTGELVTIRPSTIPWKKKLTRAFVEWLYATGAMAGVRWSEPAMREYESYKEAQQ